MGLVSAQTRNFGLVVKFRGQIYCLCGCKGAILEALGSFNFHAAELLAEQSGKLDISI